MDGSRSIPGNRYSLGFLLISALLMIVAALIILVPMSSDDSDAFIVGHYQYDVLSESDNEVRVSAYDKNVEDVTIPQFVYYEGKTYAVTQISDYGFGDMLTIKSVNLENSILEVIGSYAFYGCKNISTVTLPESLTKLNEMCFCYCESLESIWMRLNVSLIDTQVFFGCSKLRSITVDVQNEHYCAVDNVLYDKAKTRLLCYPLGKTNETYNMPNTVTSMDKYAMYCAKFKNVILSNILVSISESALEGSSIVNLKITQNVAAIGDRALVNCTNLQSITVDGSNTHYSAVDGVLFSALGTDLLVYPAGMTNETYIIPDNVKNIREYSFYNNAYLEEVYFTSGTKTIGTYAFSGCTKMARVDMTDTIETVGQYAFCGCTSLRSVGLSETMTTLEVGIFKDCTALEVFYITPNITSLMDDAFTGCTAMNSLYVPPTIVQMKSAFVGFTFYASNQITVISGLEIIGHTYMGSTSKMCQMIGTYSLIQYNEVGGSVMLDDEMIKHNTTYVFPQYPGKLDGYIFKGWLYNWDLYKPGDTMTSPIANAHISAVWEKVQEEDDSNKITLELFLGVAITGVATIVGFAAGIYYFKRFRNKQIMKDDDDKMWQK